MGLDERKADRHASLAMTRKDLHTLTCGHN